VSHLHIPDGVLPWTVWLPGLALALLLLVVTGWLQRGESRSRIAYQGAIGALMLAAMAVEIPLGPIDYHLTLVGPVGALLGPVGGFQVVFVVSAMLALVGHGGLTVVGWNALVLGAGAALARPFASVLARRFSPAVSLAIATGCAQAVSGALWLAVVAAGMRLAPRARLFGDGPGAVTVFAALALPLWLLGIGVESAVALGLGRFVQRVRPDLLPGGSFPAAPAASAPPASGGVG
jgi:cobalt/nickel transport system permease protein